MGKIPVDNLVKESSEVCICHPLQKKAAYSSVFFSGIHKKIKMAWEINKQIKD